MSAGPDTRRPTVPRVRTRVGFVRIGPHPIPNRLLASELAGRPGLQLAVLDLEALVRRDARAMATNTAVTLAEHGHHLVRGRLRRWQAFFTTTWIFRRMSEIAREWIQANDFDWTMQIQSLFDARVPGIPHFVFTDHTHLANLSYPDFDRRTLRSSRWLALERELYHEAAAVLTRSRHVSRSLIEDYACDERRVVCVGSGANVDLPEGSEPLPDRRAKNVLFVGVDWTRKGGPDLIAAFDRIRDHHPDATLTIVGCRPPVEGPGIRVLGRLPVEALPALYRDASVFCLPTHREPFGVAFVEAMHHALPVVATRIGAVPDLIVHGESGFVVPVGDVAGLANHLDRLLGDPDLRRRMGEAGARHARARYTWSAAADRILSAVERVTAAPDSTTPHESESLVSAESRADRAAIAS